MMSIPVALPEPAALSHLDRMRGHLAVGLTRLLLAATQGRPDRLTRVVCAVGRHARPATPATAQRARVVVETVSLRCGSPHGCMPRSLAALLLCRAHGQRVTWLVGVSAAPGSTHAWIEADGRPVGETFDPRLLYTPIIAI
jgi:Transglutaminase-like superfamily